jgi:hypothetical protein
MNLTSNTLMIVMVSSIFALTAAAVLGLYAGTASAQIVTGTPGEVGTTNESEDYYAPLNQTGPETIQSLEGIEGSNAAIFGNDTNISNANITAADAGTVNKQEDCLRLSNQSAVKCP